VSIAIDDTPATIHENSDLIGLSKEDPLSQTFLVTSMTIINKLYVQKQSILNI
jgi:hypothetical protein